MQKIFLKNLSYLTLIQISNTLIPLFIIPYLVRVVDQDNFGNLEFARYFCYFFTIVVNFGFDVTITRRISIHRYDKAYVDNLISQTFYTKTILLLISFLIYITLLGFIPSLADIYHLLIITFLINIGFVLFPIWYFQGIEKLSKVSVINFFIKIFIAFLTVLLIKNNSDYWIFNGLQSVSLILLGLISLGILFKGYNFEIKQIDISLCREIIVEGYPVFISTILVTFIGAIYFVVLKLFSSELELGAFSTSNKIVSSLQALILLPFSQAFFPMIAKQAKENLSLFKRNIVISSGILLVITGIIGFILIFFSNQIIIIIFGKSYLYASESLKLMAFLPMFMLLNNVFAYQGLLSLNKDKLFLFIHIIGTLLTILLCYLFIDNMNAFTVSLIRMAVEVFIFILSCAYYFSVLKKVKTI